MKKVIILGTAPSEDRLFAVAHARLVQLFPDAKRLRLHEGTVETYAGYSKAPLVGKVTEILSTLAEHGYSVSPTAVDAVVPLMPETMAATTQRGVVLSKGGRQIVTVQQYQFGDTQLFGYIACLRKP